MDLRISIFSFRYFPGKWTDLKMSIKIRINLEQIDDAFGVNFDYIYDTNKKSPNHSNMILEIQRIKQQLNKLTMHLVSIYYIYDTNKKQSQPLQRDTRPIYIHLTMMKFILTDLVINWRRRIDADFLLCFYNTNKKHHCCIRCQTFCINGKKQNYKRLSSMLDKLMTHWHQFFVIFYDVNKKTPNHSDALLVQSILT